VSPSPRVTVRAVTQNVATPSVTQLVPLVTVAPFDAIAALAAVATTTATAAANKIILFITSGAGTGRANGQPPGAPDTYVASWDAIGSHAFTASGLTPAEALPIFAYVSIAVYDSVVAIEDGYEPFAVAFDGSDGASSEAAVVAAAHSRLPAGAASRDPRSGARCLAATVPDGASKTAGVAIGDAIAALLIVQRADDGFRAPVTYTVPNPPIPGVWLPTGAVPVGPHPRSDTSVHARLSRRVPAERPAGAPRQALGRRVHRGEEIGSGASTTRTAEQTLAARDIRSEGARAGGPSSGPARGSGAATAEHGRNAARRMQPATLTASSGRRGRKARAPALRRGSRAVHPPSGERPLPAVRLWTAHRRPATGRLGAQVGE